MKNIIFKPIVLSFFLLLVLSMVRINEVWAQPSLLDPEEHPKFVTDLPNPATINATGGGNYTINMAQTSQWLGLYSGGVVSNNSKLNTTVWGYGQGRSVTYPGPTFEAMEDVALNVRWNNNLPNSGHLLPVDNTLHMAHPHGVDPAPFYAQGNIPAVVHLHGGHTESASDGLPEAWFTQKFRETGDHFIKKTYHYDNDQEAATLWYHDHALGITRLNVYAGLAGFYLLRDANEMNLINNGTLPGGEEYEREIVLQDRMFYDNGELFLPSKTGDPWFGDADGEPLELPYDPSIVAEFFGDFIIVNSVAWPKLTVKKTKYRFRMLNGSDSRVYNLSIRATPQGEMIPFYQIGTDNGLLESPVTLTELTLAPGERADLFVDFTGLSGAYTMYNTGPDGPFDGENFEPDVDRPTGQIMLFDIQSGGNPPSFSITSGTTLRPPIIPLTQTGATRKLALFEGEDADDRLQPLLGIIDGDEPKGTMGVTNGSLAWFEDITEDPTLGDVEVWEVYNNTADAHPIHLHLVSFQILERRPFTATVNNQSQIQHDGRSGDGAYVVESSIAFSGDPESPPDNEKGWKDTFIIPSGYMGKVIAKFDRPGRYVWHCHILSHEDHEMMRPYYVSPFAPPLAQKVEVEAMPVTQPSLTGTYPNPFDSRTNISFFLPKEDKVSMDVYDLNGRLVKQLANRTFEAGNNTIEWDGTDEGGGKLPDGLYLYRMQTGESVFTDQLVLQK